MQKVKGKTQMGKTSGNFFEHNKLAFHAQQHYLAGPRTDIPQRHLHVESFQSSVRVIMLPHTVLQKKMDEGPC